MVCLLMSSCVLRSSFALVDTVGRRTRLKTGAASHKRQEVIMDPAGVYALTCADTWEGKEGPFNLDRIVCQAPSGISESRVKSRTGLREMMPDVNMQEQSSWSLCCSLSLSAVMLSRSWSSQAKACWQSAPSRGVCGLRSFWKAPPQYRQRTIEYTIATIQALNKLVMYNNMVVKMRLHPVPLRIT
jgi:hypothetical protein